MTSFPANNVERAATPPQREVSDMLKLISSIGGGGSLAPTAGGGEKRTASPRTSTRSRFEEAIAATKHKSFRDKLEKMMAGKSGSASMTSAMTSSSRLPSASGDKHLYRITSPVPANFNNANNNKSPPHDVIVDDDVTSHARARSRHNNTNNSSSKLVRGPTNRNSLRGAGDDVTKVSLEEQLGQLLIDNHGDGDHGNRHRGVYDRQNGTRLAAGPLNLTHAAAVQPPVADRSPAHHHHHRTGKVPAPVDWKMKLLQHIERKKQERGPMSPTAHQPASLPTAVVVAPAERRARMLSESSSGGQRGSARRSSGRFQRTRTPGPEMESSLVRTADPVNRPKSAMAGVFYQPASAPPSPPGNTLRGETEKKKSYFQPKQAPPAPQQRPPAAQQRPPSPTKRPSSFKQPPPSPTKPPKVAPPSYQDHLKRAACKMGEFPACKTHNQQAVQQPQNYVNVGDYVIDERARAPSRRQTTDQQQTMTSQYHPLRSAGSHESVLKYNSVTEKPSMTSQAKDEYAKSNSHESLLDHHGYYQQQHDDYHHQHPHQPPYHHHYPPPFTSAVYHHHYPHHQPPDIPPRSSVFHRRYQDEWAAYQRARAGGDYPPPPFAFRDGYGNVTMAPPGGGGGGHPVKLQQHRATTFSEHREDESVASAFRPYHQPPTTTTRKHHPVNGYHPHHPPQYTNQPPVYAPTYQPPPPRPHQLAVTSSQPTSSKRGAHHRSSTAEERLSVDSETSWSPDYPHHWRDSTGVELVRVTVRKNPTFGFHIMGGVDSCENPYRPEDDGVFITYVAPGGSADGQVQAGDKILMVNGSDFVGISHKRAVDLLRNAGQVAVLVVERFSHAV